MLQPRVTPSLPKNSEGSLFQRVFTIPSGLDPYAFAVSDVYQDLFGEGSYSGKGIYDVDMFEAALARRIPESTLLSHDLLEGIFARSGLVTDIEVVEEFPSRYYVAAARQHRWARGDWQLLPWIFGRGRNSNSEHDRSAIPFVGRWKMLDNLRRTLSAPAIYLALLAGWMLPLDAAVVWTRICRRNFCDPCLHSGFRRNRAATIRALTAKALVHGRRRFCPGLVTARASYHSHRFAGLVNGRCDSPHAFPSVYQASETPGMGHGRPVESQRPPQSLRECTCG